MTVEARKAPLFGQCDLWHLRETAARVLIARRVADRVDRRLCRPELQLLALCDAILSVVRGELGTDARGDPIGDLTLREVPGLRTEHQTRLGDAA